MNIVQTRITDYIDADGINSPKSSLKPTRYNIIKRMNIDSCDGIKWKVQWSWEFFKEGVSTVGKATSRET